MNAFPEESWKIAREDMEIAKRNTKNKTAFSWAYAMMYSYADSAYGFRNCLRTGNFAPYDHERIAQNITGFNCTTIIPSIYMRAHIAGLEPRIVQFIDFTNIDPKESKEERDKMESHFALIVNAGRKHEYLIDPFHSIFGPILKDNGQEMRVGKVGKYRAVRRTYRQLIPYTPEQFGALMTRMHDPAQSLEMLEAGQKVWGERTVLHSNCQVMAYYDSERNILTTRLYIPQVAIRPKVVYCHQKLDENGDLIEREIELFNAKDKFWRGLSQGKRLGSFTFGFFEGLQSRIREQVQRRQRIGPSALSIPEFASRIEEYVTPAFDSLSPTEQKDIRKMLLVRALYETEKPEQQYLFTDEERTKYLKRMLSSIWTQCDERKPISREEYVHKVKLEKHPTERIRELRREEKRLDKEIKQKDDEFIELITLRNRYKPAFLRTMDKVLYAQKLEDISIESLEKRLKRKDTDILLGYVATIADFVPYVRNAYEELTLHDTMQTIKDKIKAKYAPKINPAVPLVLSATEQEPVLPVQAALGG
ncbi:hypothetical protein J4219_09200 [Candidatus Woesearchaeota archaeon]|nr:hypothetical protein [Candidatus Woesearchaeota archaeon]